MGRRKMCSKKDAYRFYFPECDGKCRKGWVLHHKDPSWKYDDPIRYAEWRIEDLIPMTLADHNKMHHSGDNISQETRMKLSYKASCRKLDEETKLKISIALKGHTVSEEERRHHSEVLKGHKMSEETKRKISETLKKRRRV